VHKGARILNDEINVCGTESVDEQMAAVARHGVVKWSVEPTRTNRTYLQDHLAALKVRVFGLEME